MGMVFHSESSSGVGRGERRPTRPREPMPTPSMTTRGAAPGRQGNDPCFFSWKDDTGGVYAWMGARRGGNRRGSGC